MIENQEANIMQLREGRIRNAAPAMLAALIELTDIVQNLLDDTNLHGLGIDSVTLQPANAAIALATGEAVRAANVGQDLHGSPT